MARSRRFTASSSGRSPNAWRCVLLNPTARRSDPKASKSTASERDTYFPGGKFLSQSAEIFRGGRQARALACFHAEKQGQSLQTRRTSSRENVTPFHVHLSRELSDFGES